VFRNILVAVDGSPTSTAALEEAIDLARSDGARLVLISVGVPLRFRFSGPTYVPYPNEHDLEAAAWEIVRRAEATVPADVPVTSIVRVGPPAATIVARAEEGGHDLVVMGSRGHGVLGSILLGSVSRDVIARSPVPVLVARRRRDEGEQTAGGGASRELPAASAAAAVSMQAEPTAEGAPAVFLWLVVVLLLELELAWWIVNRMYEP
jgi:nucleotide-binding universal stress UspA family protein